MTRHALTRVNVITGDREGTVLTDRAVIIDGTTIVDVVSTDQLPSGIQTTNLKGHFVLPGLINAHAHLFSDGKPLPSISESPLIGRLVSAVIHGPIGRRLLRTRTRTNALTQLHTGVTTVRSLGDFGDEVLKIRDEINEGKTTGPTLLASGPLLAATGGHGAPDIALVADDPWGARGNARRNIAMGVDVIKIAATGGVTDARSLGEAGRAQLTTEEMSAICEEAHNADKVVAAHVQGEVGLIAALRAGVDTIEHGCQLSPEAIELFHDNPKALRGRSFLVPTLCAALPFAELDQSQTGVSDVVKANGEKIFQGMVDGLSCAIEHDVPLGIGNDSSMTYVTHYDFWRELEAWTLYSGLSRADVLNVATQGNADMLGLTLKGRLEPGKDADLVVVKKSPLEGFDTLASPRMVVARGEIINHPQVERFAEVDTDLDAIFDNLRKNRAA